MKTMLWALIGMLTVTIGSCDIPKTANGTDKDMNPIIEELYAIKGKGILFGHQDDLAYGIGWNNSNGDSDVKRLCGDYPALLGWDLGGIEFQQAANLDNVSFQKIRQFTIWGYENGAINTFSWHAYSPIDSVGSSSGDSVVVKHILPGGTYHEQFKIHLNRVAEFFLSLVDLKGNRVPFIFRPWHEMDGTWFWWGQKVCSAEEYKTLFRFTIDYLKEKGIDNMVVAYSPDRNFESEEEYMKWYPGDEYVDILGMDNYWDFKSEEGEKVVVEKLKLIVEIAKEKGKLSAFTETGSDMLLDSTWYGNKLDYVLSDSLINKELSYVMVWRNHSKEHFFFPYPEHSAAADARAFIDNDYVLLLNEFNDLKK